MQSVWGRERRDKQRRNAGTFFKRRHSKSLNETTKTQRGSLFWSITPENLHQTFNQNDYREKSYCLSTKKSQTEFVLTFPIWNLFTSNWRTNSFKLAVVENYIHIWKLPIQENKKLIPTRQSYKPPKAVINSQKRVFLLERTYINCVFQNAIKRLIGRPEVKDHHLRYLMVRGG